MARRATRRNTRSPPHHAFHARAPARRAARRFAWPHRAAFPPPELHKLRAATPPAAQRPASPLEPHNTTPS